MVRRHQVIMLTALISFRGRPTSTVSASSVTLAYSTTMCVARMRRYSVHSMEIDISHLTRPHSRLVFEYRVCGRRLIPATQAHNSLGLTRTRWAPRSARPHFCHFCCAARRPDQQHRHESDVVRCTIVSEELCRPRGRWGMWKIRSDIRDPTLPSTQCPAI